MKTSCITKIIPLPFWRFHASYPKRHSIKVNFWQQHFGFGRESSCTTCGPKVELGKLGDREENVKKVHVISHGKEFNCAEPPPSSPPESLLSQGYQVTGFSTRRDCKQKSSIALSTFQTAQESVWIIVLKLFSLSRDSAAPLSSRLLIVCFKKCQA